VAVLPSLAEIGQTWRRMCGALALNRDNLAAQLIWKKG
jgi:hypothetical protein